MKAMQLNAELDLDCVSCGGEFQIPFQLPLGEIEDSAERIKMIEYTLSLLEQRECEFCASRPISN